MNHVKRMNESYFAELLKELNVVGELIRARQEEKQGVLDEFESESNRFFFGKISERALASSAKKTNKELGELDREIRKNITRARSIAGRLAKVSSSQAPEKYTATLSGIKGETKKKPKRKKASGKKSAKKKKVKKKKPSAKKKK
jgi:hypothetical protein